MESAVLWRCIDCGLEFVDEGSLLLHTQLHDSGDNHLNQKELLLRRALLYDEVRRQEDEENERKALADPLPSKPRRIYKPNSKRVGLTKIRLEDCFRCDPCSCIYIDEQDYYKHMRNFHQKYNTVIPRSRKRSQFQQRCHMTTTEVPTKPDLEALGKFFKETIKNRWSKVSERLSTVKQEPYDDMDYFLRQVEVKIKTEPVDY